MRPAVSKLNNGSVIGSDLQCDPLLSLVRGIDADHTNNRRNQSGNNDDSDGDQDHIGLTRS